MCSACRSFYLIRKFGYFPLSFASRFQRPTTFICFKSFIKWILLPPRPGVVSSFPRWQFSLRRYSIQSTFLRRRVVRIDLSSLTLLKISSIRYLARSIYFSMFLHHHISKLCSYFFSIVRNVDISDL